MLWRTAGSLTLIMSVMAAAVVFCFRDALAAKLLKDPKLSGVFGWLAASLVFISLNSLLLAILNGRKEVRRYILVSIAGSAFALLISVLLVRVWGLYGALVALSFNQACVFLFTFAACRRTTWFRIRDLWGSLDRSITANLGRFVLMAVASVTTVPLSQILIRREIVGALGIDHAGYWDASMKLSNTYLTLATTTLSLYLLPRLSELDTLADVRKEVWKGYRIIIPATAVAALAFYVLRKQVILAIFTPSFMPMADLLGWQLCGDVIKMASWLLGYVLIARARTVQFISTEIVFSLASWALTIGGIHLFGFRGISIAYATTYALHFATMYVLVMGFDRRARHAPVAI